SAPPTCRGEMATTSTESCARTRSRTEPTATRWSFRSCGARRARLEAAQAGAQRGQPVDVGGSGGGGGQTAIAQRQLAEAVVVVAGDVGGEGALLDVVARIGGRQLGLDEAHEAVAPGVEEALAGRRHARPQDREEALAVLLRVAEVVALRSAV